MEVMLELKAALRFEIKDWEMKGSTWVHGRTQNGVVWSRNLDPLDETLQCFGIVKFLRAALLCFQ